MKKKANKTRKKEEEELHAVNGSLPQTSIDLHVSSNGYFSMTTACRIII
jgi:hypothetical protein